VTRQLDPKACAECLRRSRLLAHLAPYIEKLAAGSPSSLLSELLCLGNEELAARAASEAADRIIARIDSLPEKRLRGELAAAGCWSTCRHDRPYPVGLRDAAEAPWALIGKGDPALLERLHPAGAVTVVGARRARSYGREVARQLGRELAAAGLVVVSGLAFGIDACAHRGALEAGSTVAVLGCGADVAYPAAHRSLWRRIAEGGLVLSELPPGCGAWRWTFPARNRIMAALAGMTVVVEAAERSGSLLTAEMAAELGRELGAVPGPIGSRLSAGPNRLLADGACLVRDARDVLAAMRGPGARRLERTGPPLGPRPLAALESLEQGAETSDAVAADLGLSGAQTAVVLAELEAAGYVSCSLAGVYARTRLRPPAETWTATKEEGGSNARVQIRPRQGRAVA
jgi:DNA processing protein